MNWETFVYDLHPYRDPTRIELIRDGSAFQQEAARSAEIKSTPELQVATPYKPDVFKLTEPRATPSPRPQS